MSYSRQTRSAAVARFRDERRAMRERETEARREAMLGLAQDVTEFVIETQRRLGVAAEARAEARARLLAELRAVDRARADAARSALADIGAARARDEQARAAARRAEVLRIVSEDFRARAAMSSCDPEDDMAA